MLNSNKQDTREEIKYSKKDIEHIEKWGAYPPSPFPPNPSKLPQNNN